MLIDGEKVCFHTQICKMVIAKKCIEEALNSLSGFYQLQVQQVGNGVMYFSILNFLKLGLVILCFFDGIFLNF